MAFMHLGKQSLDEGKRECRSHVRDFKRCSGIPPSCWFNGIARSLSRASPHPQLRLRTADGIHPVCACVGAEAHLFCRGSVLTGCNLQMLRPVGFIGTPLPSHYATLCPPLFSPSPAGPPPPIRLRSVPLRSSSLLVAPRRSYFHPPIRARPWYVARDYRQLTYT